MYLYIYIYLYKHIGTATTHIQHITTVITHAIKIVIVSVDAFTNQIVNLVTDELDKVASLKRCARCPSKPITKWL